MFQSVIRKVLISAFAFLPILAVGQIMVTTVSDDGAGSLREAIETANSNAGADEIQFDPTLTGMTISLSSAITITNGNGDQTTIDGDIDGDGLPDITLSGGSYDGIIIDASNCSISGLNLQGFAGAGNASMVIDGTNGATGNAIFGNYIGTTLDGQSAGTANFYGVEIRGGATANFIGDGTASGRNVISNNTFGIYINASNSNTLSGNIIGLDVDGTAALGNVGRGVEVISSDFTKIGVSGEVQNVISGNGQQGINLQSSTNTIVVNNKIGVRLTGSQEVGNGSEGILMDENSGNTSVGDGTPEGRNIIGFNGQEGLQIESDNNVILGNYIGVDGFNPRGNTNTGIWITPESNGNKIGDGTVDGRNVIGDNGAHGILISGGTHEIYGNYIGLHSSGGARGNTLFGISIAGGANTKIGDAASGFGNTISSNSAGIAVTVSGVSILGNVIGLNPNATVTRPNTNEGIRLTGSAQNTVVGDGTEEGANVISGNTGAGILIDGANVTGNDINTNYIGVEGDFETAAGNGANGILISGDANGNTIQKNLIANNAENGIEVNGLSGATDGNTFSQNKIYDNTERGISVINGGQEGLAAPVITAFTTARQVSGTTANDETIELFFSDEDEGNYFLTTISATAGTWTYTIPAADFPLSLDKVTATATNTNGSTSEFSNAFESAFELLEVVNTNDEGVGSLRWCLDNANAFNDKDTITFNIPDTDPNYDNSAGRETWTISPASNFINLNNPVVVDAASQEGTGNFRIVMDGQDVRNHAFSFTGNGSAVFGFYIRRYTNAGINLFYPASGVIVGAPGKGNTIVECGGGISLGNSDNAIIQGNFIGTDENGANDLGNSGTGISFGSYASSGIVGGTEEGERNIISGNSGNGIGFNVSGGAQIINNYIGTDPTGMNAIPNNGSGIYVGNSGSGTIKSNVISGNTNYGIYLHAGGNNNTIQDNKIGVGSDGVESIPNGSGIGSTSGADNNIIGGLGANESNIIANNTDYGIRFSTTSEENNTFIGNIMYCNGIGIYLGSDGNNGVERPVVTEITSNSVSGTANESEVVHLYKDNGDCNPVQAREYLGTDSVTSSGTWSITGLTLDPSDFVNATSTDTLGNTSEFSFGFGEIAVYDGNTNGTELNSGMTGDHYMGVGLNGLNFDHTITIENQEGAPINISSIIVTGSDYSIVNAPTKIGAYDTETFTLRLDGSTSGIYRTTLTINNDDEDEGTFTVPVIAEIADNIINEKPGNALNFDGSDDYIDLGTNNLQVVGNLTIEAWIYLESYPTEAAVIVSRSVNGETEATNINYQFRVNADSTIGLVYEYGSGLNISTWSDEKISLNNWTHVAVTRLISGGQAEMIFFIDGKNSSSKVDSNIPSGGASGTPWIGRNNQGSFLYPFDGSIDDVRIWDDVRTSTEIRNNRYSELSGNEENLVAYYKFDHGSPDNPNSTFIHLIDFAGGTTGTLNNFALSGNSSNWVISEGLTPEGAKLLNPTNFTKDGFELNFVAPNEATNTILDIDDNADFSSPVATNISTGISGKFKVQGSFDPSNTYYFRLTTSHSGENSLPVISDGYKVRPGNGLSFDGSNDYVDVPDADSLQIASEVSITGWVKRTRLDDIDIILEKGGDWTGGGTNYGLGLHDNSENNMFYFFFDGGWRGVTGVTDTDWHHYAVVAEEGQSNPQFYIDGVLKSVEYTMGVSTIELDETSSDALHIGAQIDGSFDYYGANVIDEIQIWNRSLTEDEIKTLMYKSLKGDESGLVAYYLFDEGNPGGTNTGLDELLDHSGNKNTGSLNGFALSGTSSNWVNSEAGFPVSEYDALAAFYTSANGNSWTNSTNWLTDDIFNWYGLEVTANSVSALELGSNNLSGTISQELTSLNGLDKMDFSGNGLTSLPDLSLLTPSVFDVSNNTLEFDDLEPNSAILSNYTPQAQITGPEDQFLKEGDTLSVSVTVGGANNEYQWVKDGVDLTGKTSNTLNIQGVVLSDSGDYHLKISNTNLSGLTLTSSTFKVSIAEVTNAVVTASASDTVICIGESVTLTGSGMETYSWDQGVENGVSFIPQETRTYTVTGTDSQGKTATDQITVKVNPLPEVSIQSSAFEFICAGESLTLSGEGASTYQWDHDVENAVSFVPTSTATYNTVGTDVNGCVDSASITMIVIAVPEPTIEVDDEVGRHLSLKTNEVYSGYQWYRNGEAIPEANEQSLEIIITDPNADIYQVEHLHDRCSNISQEFFAPVLGIGEEELIQVYPNPVFDQLYIEGVDLRIDAVKIYDTKGVLMKTSIERQNSGIFLNVKAFPRGVYLLTLDSRSIRFIKN